MTLPPPERLRLFFALAPSPALAQTFYQLANSTLRDCRGRRLKPEQIHLTLRFIGSVNDEVATCLQDAAGHIHLPAFDLVFDTLGYWPRPRVVWSMPSHVPTALTDLAAQLERICVGCGLPAETRTYVPHLTLLRNARHRPPASHMPSLHWPVAAFALMRSETLPQGAIYTELQRWLLH